MTDPEDLVELEVPSEQLREGDLLTVDTVEHAVERVLVDVAPEFVYAFVPDQLPLPRGVLVAVRRPRSQTTLARPPEPAPPDDLAAVRDLALALADRSTAQGPGSVDRATKRVTDAAARVRGAR